MLKALTLLILTAIVMASVACGSSEEGLHQKQKELIQQQKIIMLCEDALERRANAENRIGKFQSEVSKPENTYWRDNPAKMAIAEEKKNIKSIIGDINRYCK